jgi:hypothetical protein
MLPLEGGCTVSEPVPDVNVSGTNRWFSLNAWVAEPNAISDTDAMRVESGVVTVKPVPYCSTLGAGDEITGRDPLKR